MIDNPNQHIILVSGATGNQGGAVARHLLQHGFRVRALTRNPESDAARALAELGAEVLEGDFDDRSSLQRALTDVHGAYSVQTFFAGIEAEVRHGKAFADAAKEAGVKHFVYSSVGGAERQSGVPHFDSKWQIEEHIRQIGLPSTILRPVFFMENWAYSRDIIASGQFPQPLSPETTLQQIAVDDIGAFAALAFANPEEWTGRATELAGDELTMPEMAATFSRVLNLEVDYVQVPWDAFEAQAGPEMAGMYRWLEQGGYEADITALRNQHPDLKHLESFLREKDWNQQP